MAIQNRYEIVMIYDVTNGNPNGDPDAENRPRMDQDDYGIITDVCIKRKIRNAIDLIGEGAKPGKAIYITEGAILTDAHNAALTAAGVSEDAAEDEAEDDADDDGAAKKGKEKAKKSNKASPEAIAKATKQLCEIYYDIRAFGAALTNKRGNDKVRGPVQFGFARSLEPIRPERHTITRCAATNAEEAKEAKTMGAKWTVPYAAYRMHGFITPALADKTGFDDQDLELLCNAIQRMFDLDRAAARGEMNLRKLVLLKHDSKLGSARSADVLSTVRVDRVGDASQPAKSWADYAVSIGDMPQGVAAREIV